MKQLNFSMKHILCLSLVCLAICLNACQSNTAENSNYHQVEHGMRGKMNDQERSGVESLKKLMDAGMLAETIEDANNLLAKYPKNVEALNYRGLARARTEDLQGGIKDFDEAIRIDPAFVRPYCNKGLALYKLGDKAGARSHFDQAIKIDPYDAKSYFNRGILNFDETKKGEACVDWRKAKELGYEDRMGYYEKYCEGEGVPITHKK